ncbi:unnamed protein product [Aphis gossypii]|uniref:Uncharacterized protein n=1 Tax=Aphis gossypii TaxID=80765 RepID=A0A9P0JDE3_APHGO|nr:unnamed protein product [Aphis gossypii]
MPTTYLYVVSGRRIVLTGCRGQRRLSPAATWWMVVRNIFSHLTTGPSPYASSSDDDDDDDTLSEPQFPELSSPELLPDELPPSSLEPPDELPPSSLEPLDELPPSKDDPREISPPNGQPTADMVRLRCGPVQAVLCGDAVSLQVESGQSYTAVRVGPGSASVAATTPK